jgi:hypothetical protein
LRSNVTYRVSDTRPNSIRASLIVIPSLGIS